MPQISAVQRGSDEVVYASPRAQGGRPKPHSPGVKVARMRQEGGKDLDYRCGDPLLPPRACLEVTSPHPSLEWTKSAILYPRGPFLWPPPSEQPKPLALDRAYCDLLKESDTLRYREQE